MAFLIGAVSVVVGMLLALFFDYLISKTSYTPKHTFIRWIILFLSFVLSLILCFVAYLFIIYYLEGFGYLLSNDKPGWAMRNSMTSSFICVITLFRWIRK